MKKIMSMFLLLSMFAITSVLPASAESLTFESADTGFDALYEVDGNFEVVETAESGAVAPCRAGTFRVRNRTSTKKKLLNSAIAGGIGAAVGGGIAGKRGALVGLGSGAGGYLVYRYVRDRRGNCVRRYVGRG